MRYIHIIGEQRLFVAADEVHMTTDLVQSVDNFLFPIYTDNRPILQTVLCIALLGMWNICPFQPP